MALFTESKALEIDDTVDRFGTLSVYIENYSDNSQCDITKEDAIAIIKHLQEVFEIE